MALEIKPGSEFAGHRIDGVAGRGGMGIVYRATDLMLDRTVALGDEHVAGLDVAVHEPVPVRLVEAGRDLLDQRERALGLEPRAALEHLAQVGPLDVAHRDEQVTVGLAGLVHGHHMRVLDPGGDP